jgi:hypothetical protein
MNSFINRFQKGYYRPISMPIWKWIIVCAIWVIAVIGYIGSFIVNPWLLIVGMIFQVLGLMLMLSFDTGSWRNTESGKEYLNMYGE